MKAFEFIHRDWPASTETRKLSSRVWRQATQENMKAIMLTSALRGEGKSTTAATLAAALSTHPNRKIIAVDLDFRIPQLSHHFEGLDSIGLSDVLHGDCRVEEAIQSAADLDLDLLPAGTQRRYPDQLVQSPQLIDIVDTLRETYDLIIIDGPAIVPVADPSAIIPLADGILLVVMAGKTPKIHFSRARELCLGMGAKIMGLVVVNAQEALPSYYHPGHYGHYPSPDAKKPIRKKMQQPKA